MQSQKTISQLKSWFEDEELSFPIWQRLYEWSEDLYEELFNMTLLNFRGDQVEIDPIMVGYVSSDEIFPLYQIEYTNLVKQKSHKEIRNNNFHQKFLNDGGQRTRTILNACYGQYVKFTKDKLTPYYDTNEQKLRLFNSKKSNNSPKFVDDNIIYLKFKELIHIVEKIESDYGNAFAGTHFIDETKRIFDLDKSNEWIIKNIINCFEFFWNRIPIQIIEKRYKNKESAWNAFERKQQGERISDYSQFVTGQSFHHNVNNFEKIINNEINNILANYPFYKGKNPKEEFIKHIISYANGERLKRERPLINLKNEIKNKITVDYVKNFSVNLNKILSLLKDIKLPYDSLLPFDLAYKNRINILIPVKYYELCPFERTWPESLIRYWIYIQLLQSKISEPFIRECFNFFENSNIDSLNKLFNEFLNNHMQKITDINIDIKKIIYFTCWLDCQPESRKTSHLHHIIPESKGGIKNLGNITCIGYRDNITRYNKMPEEIYGEYSHLREKECVPSGFLNLQTQDEHDRFYKCRTEIVISRLKEVLDYFKIKYSDLDDITKNFKENKL